MKNEILMKENLYLKKWKDDIYDKYNDYVPKLALREWVANSDFVPLSKRKVNIFNTPKIEINGDIYYDVSEIEKRYKDEKLLKYHVLSFFRDHFRHSYSPEELYRVVSEITYLGNMYGEDYNDFSFDDAVDISIKFSYSEYKTMILLQEKSLIILDNLEGINSSNSLQDPIKLNSGRYLIKSF